MRWPFFVVFVLAVACASVAAAQDAGASDAAVADDAGALVDSDPSPEPNAETGGGVGPRALPAMEIDSGAPTMEGIAADAALGVADSAAGHASEDGGDAGASPVVESPPAPAPALAADTHDEPPAGFAQPTSPRRPRLRPRPPPAAGETTGVVIKTILGLAALLLVAYAGAHPRVKRIEEALGISQVITAGFPFVALGLIARLPAVGVLTDEVLVEINPLLLFGLGWIGFQEGCRFDVRSLDRLPSGTALVIILSTSIPFVVIATASAFLMIRLGEPVADGTFLRDAICLGAAGAMTAPRIVRAALPHSLSDSFPGGQDVAAQVGQLDDIAGIVALAFLAAYFRPAGHEFTWQIPPLAWLFVALGLGVAVGIVIYAMLRRPLSGSEFLAVVLGSVAFAAGLAGYLRLSPVVVGFVAGTLVGNFPFDQKAALRDVLGRLERPVYLMFLMVAGALWNIGDWRGWLFVPVFVVCRFVGRGIALVAARRAAGPLPPELAEPTSVVAPLSVLAIGIVVSAQSLYRGRAIHWIVTAVIAGAIVTEILVQLAVRIFPSRPAAPKQNPDSGAQRPASGDRIAGGG
ncbi:MAG: hypothetical protein IT379_40840 [Deltaproteobacteria bacterium]|nr:hypothetical protein [Deltaproteobacteria bacterium]